MNKFFAFAILAVVCASACAEEINDEMSQFAITTNDDEEVANVPEDLKVAFKDFCLSSRDFVLDDMKNLRNSMASNVFNIFFNSVEALGKESMDNQRLATERLAKQLANPASPIEKGEGKVDEIIAAGQERIQGQSTPMALFTAIKTSFAATSSSVGAFVTEKLDNLKKFASIEQVGAGIVEACGKVRSYEETIKKQLEDYKVEALNSEAKYNGVNLDQVKCATARRLSQIEGGCVFVNNLKPLASKMLG